MRRASAILNPLLLFMLNILVGMAISQQVALSDKIGAMDTKIFAHLTNDEIHAPRSMFVDTATFNVYQKMRDTQTQDIDKSLREIRDLMITHMKQ